MTVRNPFPVPPAGGGGRPTGTPGRVRLAPAFPAMTALLILLAGTVPGRVRAAPLPGCPGPPQDPAQQEKLTIGVLDLDAEGVDDTEARTITGRLRIWLGRTGAFEVIERNQMENIMEEMGFQFSGACDTDECVVQVGRVLGASKMVAGSVSKVGSLYSLQIRIIDITTSRIEHTSFNDEPRGIEFVLTEATREVANELAANVTGQAVETTEPAQPAVAQPGRVTTANVRVESDPPGAAITYEGNDLGTTPATIILPEGSQQIVLALDGYRERTRTIEVIAGRNQDVTVELEEIPTGFLNLTTDPVQCEVFIDGENVGQRSPLQRWQVYEGTHQIEVRRQGYESQTRRITIAPRQTTTEEFTLRRSGSAQITFRSTLNGGRLTITGDEEEAALLANPEQTVAIPPGNYTLTVKAKGYAPWRQQLTLGDGANEIVPVTLRPKSRIVAGFLSLLPGMGQFYSGRGMMGVLWLGGVGATAGMALGEQGTYDGLLDEYDALKEEYDNATTTAEINNLRTQMEEKYAEVQDSYDKMSSMASIMTIVYAVNVLDAFALMPRLRPFGSGLQTDLDLGVHQGRLCFTLTLGF